MAPPGISSLQRAYGRTLSGSKTNPQTAMRQVVSRHLNILRKITVPICTRFLPRLKENRIHVHQRQSRSGATPGRGPRG